MTDSQPDPREVMEDAMQGWGLDNDWAADAILSALQEAGLKVLGPEASEVMLDAAYETPSHENMEQQLWKAMWDAA